MKIVNLLNQKIGRLTVVAVAPTKKRKKQWLCVCDCGNKTVVSTSGLRRTRSCGCLIREVNRAKAIARNTVHGHNRAGRGNQSPTWTSWSAMKHRCAAKSGTNFEHYVKREITVCDAWQEFPNFLRDMGERPLGKTLDRINNDGNYEPSNCRWATSSEQQKNKADKYNKDGLFAFMTQHPEVAYSKVYIGFLIRKGKSFEEIISKWRLKHAT